MTWSSRLGWIVPSWNTVIEYEVARLTPPTASNHFARIAHTEDSEPAFARMVDEAADTSVLLSHAQLDALCFACTAASFFRGRQADAELRERLADVTGLPVVTMADAIVQAAEHLGLQRLAVAAPYEPWLFDLLVRYLAEAGFEISGQQCLGEQANVRHGPEKAVELAQAAWTPEADGIVISCGNFRTLEVIEEIEGLAGAPVVTSIQAAAWATCRAAGVQLEDGPGRLLQATA